MSIESMLEYCVKKAREGDSGGRCRVYSVATDKRGNYLGEAMNSYVQTHPKQAKYGNVFGRLRDCNIGSHVLHSEVKTLIKSAKSGRKVTDLYIARVDKQGNIKNAKPCVICQAMITSEFPTLNVHYTEENSG